MAAKPVKFRDTSFNFGANRKAKGGKGKKAGAGKKGGRGGQGGGS